jgi:hypothetical protein
MLSIILHLKYFASFHDKVFLNPAARCGELTKLRDANTTNTYIIQQQQQQQQQLTSSMQTLGKKYNAHHTF